jgi:hypothetical protein
MTAMHAPYPQHILAISGHLRCLMDKKISILVMNAIDNQITTQIIDLLGGFEEPTRMKIK